MTLCIIRLQELTVCTEDNVDVHDIELMQYINVDCSKLKRLLQGLLLLFYRLPLCTDIHCDLSCCIVNVVV